MGKCVYVDTTSIVCQSYNPPLYQLAANIIIYDKVKPSYSSVETNYFRYDYDKGYVYGSPDGLKWSDELTWTGKYSDYANQRFMSKAKIIWKAAYNTEWNH